MKTALPTITATPNLVKLWDSNFKAITISLQELLGENTTIRSQNDFGVNGLSSFTIYKKGKKYTKTHHVWVTFETERRDTKQFLVKVYFYLPHGALAITRWIRPKYLLGKPLAQAIHLFIKTGDVIGLKKIPEAAK